MKQININDKINNLAKRNVKDSHYRQWDTAVDREVIREYGEGEYLYAQRDCGTHILYLNDINDTSLKWMISAFRVYENLNVYKLDVTEFMDGIPYGTVKRLNDQNTILEQLESLQ